MRTGCAASTPSSTKAEVKYALGRSKEHILALENIRGIVDTSADPPRRATWHYWSGFLHATSGGRPDVAIAYCQEATKIASAAALDEINAFAESCLAQVYMIAGRLHEGSRPANGRWRAWQHAPIAGGPGGRGGI